MRGSRTGALERTYLHSAITEALWYAVVETENLFEAKLAHAIMLASLYGHPDAKLSDGNDQIHEMYLRALNTVPYVHATTRTSAGEADKLVEEWKRLNAEEAVRKAREQETATETGRAVKEEPGVRG